MLVAANDTMKADYRTLQSEYKGLKSTYNEMKLSQTQMKGQLEEAREQFTMLDVEHTKAVNRCEVLSTLNMSLEEDRKNLMSQVRNLCKKNPIYRLFFGRYSCKQHSTKMPKNRVF